MRQTQVEAAASPRLAGDLGFAGVPPGCWESWVLHSCCPGCKQTLSWLGQELFEHCSFDPLTHLGVSPHYKHLRQQQWHCGAAPGARNKPLPEAVLRQTPEAHVHRAFCRPGSVHVPFLHSSFFIPANLRSPFQAIAGTRVPITPPSAAACGCPPAYMVWSSFQRAQQRSGLPGRGACTSVMFHANNSINEVHPGRGCEVDTNQLWL